MGGVSQGVQQQAHHPADIHFVAGTAAGRSLLPPLGTAGPGCGRPLGLCPSLQIWGAERVCACGVGGDRQETLARPCG